MAHLLTTPLDPAQLIASLDDPAHGGLVLFLGRVRDHHQGRGVLALEYSSYGAMAEESCAAIAAEAESRWPVRVALAHRLGRLEVGEVAVVVVTAGGHRDECYAANRWVIDALKARVPIWKREWYGDGTSTWIDPTTVDQAPA
jgi:molybdopterin synthase catalytic subunit